MLMSWFEKRMIRQVEGWRCFYFDIFFYVFLLHPKKIQVEIQINFFVLLMWNIRIGLCNLQTNGWFDLGDVSAQKETIFSIISFWRFFVNQSTTFIFPSTHFSSNSPYETWAQNDRNDRQRPGMRSLTKGIAFLHQMVHLTLRFRQCQELTQASLQAGFCVRDMMGFSRFRWLWM